MHSLFKKIMVLTLIVNTLTAGELSPRLVNVEFEVEGPQNKALKLQYNGDDFTVMNPENGEMKAIQQYNLHRDLRGLDTHRLRIMALNSRFVARADGNGEYHLVHYPRLKGGTPILGGIFSWGVRTIGYGVPAALAVLAIAAAAPATGGGSVAATATLAAKTTVGLAVGGVTDAAIGVSAIGTSIATATGAVGSTAAVAATGATIATGAVSGGVAMGVVNAVGTAAATEAVKDAVVISAMSGMSYTAWVESIANAAFLFGCSIPWL